MSRQNKKERQVHEFMKQFDTPQRFLEAMGYEGGEGDDEEDAALPFHPG